MTNNIFNNCLCEYCTNVELKVEAINKVGRGKLLKSRYDLLNKTMCQEGNYHPFHARDCIERRCENCGVENLKDKILKWFYTNGTKEIEWNRWENQTVEFNGEKKQRKILQLKKSSVSTFLNEFSLEQMCSAHTCTMQNGNIHNFAT